MLWPIMNFLHHEFLCFKIDYIGLENLCALVDQKMIDDDWKFNC